MKSISIDIESYSDIDLGSSGVYRYVDSPNFQILLFAYSVDNGAVKVIDLTAGERIPEQILDALSDSNVQKWAYNASFERVCLSKFLGMPTGQYLNPKGWYCSLTWGAYLGLPLGLAKIGEVLQLDKQKLGEGKKLIKFFCVPEKDGSRNQPQNYPIDWEQFKAYNCRDVETEQEVQQRLRRHPVPKSVWEEYWIDQEINDRGVGIDLTLAKAAVKINEDVSTRLLSRIKELTGVSNPNSTAQLTQWLYDQGVNPDSFGKKDVAQLIKDTDDPIVQEVLQLRLMAAKSSIKKYIAMLRATCSDGRARGMFQFYGGSRTGRWAGRILQLQNLPQNHLENLGLIRAVARQGDAQEVGMLYDSVLDVLSQLIRTAFIARDGTRFVVADFSAIEARVIAWLAREAWRMQAFAEGKDIYCASASAMFGVPVVKHGINGELRQKGKVAELACIAEGQLVLTNHGEKPIETVTTDDLVWDGEQWVAHEGVIYKGIQEVMTYDGLTATPDHLVYVEGQKGPMDFRIAATSSAHLLQTGDRGAALWLGEGKTKVYDIRNAGPNHRYTVSGKLVHNCGYGGGAGALKAMGASDMGLSDDEIEDIVVKWREASPNIVNLWRGVNQAAKQAIETGGDHYLKMPDLSHGKRLTDRYDLKFRYDGSSLIIRLPSGRSLFYQNARIGLNRFGNESIIYDGITANKTWGRLETYGGKLVENIVQATARDLLCNAMRKLKGLRICMHIHDEVVIEADESVQLSDVCRKMAEVPDWATGLILNADGYETPFYKKD